jgi:hypothetical protein
MKKTIITYAPGIILCAVLLFQTAFGFSKGNYFFPGISLDTISLTELKKDSTLKIIKTFKEYKRLFGLTDIHDTVNHFYSADIDNDSTSELLYYGLINAEGYWTIIWKADHQSYRLLGECYGKINGIGDSLSISTVAPACRGSDCGFANQYRIKDDWADFVQSVAVFRSVSLPESPPIRKRIITSEANRCLRAQPVVNDSPDSMNIERYGVLRGNTLALLDKGAKASATASFKDVTGKEWLFLVLDDPSNADYNVYKGFKKKNRRICGWMTTQTFDYREIH